MTRYKCPMPAVIYQKYSGMHLCQSHFDDDVHRKVRETIRQTAFAHGLRLALAMMAVREQLQLMDEQAMFGEAKGYRPRPPGSDDHGPGAKSA